MASLRSENGSIAGATWPGMPGMLIDQTDVISNSSSLMDERRVLIESLLALPPQGWLQVRVHGMLRQWDYDLSGKTRLGNASAAVYQAWIWHLARDTFQNELGPELFARYWMSGLATQALVGLAASPDDKWNEVTRRAYAEALDDLGRHYGDLHTIWEWDAMHAAQLRHPLGDAWLFDHTVKLGGDAPFDPGQPDDPLNAYGPVLIPSLQVNAQGFALAGGQSGHPFSSHYVDLVTLWARRQSVPLQDAARPQDLTDVEGVLVLTP
jgi:acyl-homoserine lactone acylase PvdQ